MVRMYNETWCPHAKLRMVRATGGFRAGEPSNHRPFKFCMLDLARILWTLALAALILALLITRRFRALPVFSAYLLATGLQAAFHWRNLDMHSSWWIAWTIPLATLKAASMAEAFWLRATGMTRRPLWLLALAGVSAGAVFLAGRVPDDSPWLMAAMVFRHVEAGMLAFGLLCIWVSWLLKKSDGKN